VRSKPNFVFFHGSTSLGRLRVSALRFFDPKTHGITDKICIDFLYVFGWRGIGFWPPETSIENDSGDFCRWYATNWR
jgi:hypothetical protein